MTFVTPKRIMSPISGEAVEPRLKTFRSGNKRVTEAHWTCPTSGEFIRKGVVSVEDISEKKSETN